MDKQSYVDLPAIVIGTGVALAISIVFAHFGGVLGLAAANDPAWEPDTVVGQVIAISLWGLWVQVMASLIGGYLAGRMRTPVDGSSAHEREMRDGVHGLSVWAMGTVLVAVGAAVVAAIAAITPEVETQPAEDVLRLNDKAAIILAFSTAAVSLVSAVAAWFAATKGGEHRDEALDLSHVFSFRKR